ncbi:MAG: hypothetical protein AAF593_05095 [Planctomycetota bacterium]
MSNRIEAFEKQLVSLNGKTQVQAVFNKVEFEFSRKSGQWRFWYWNNEATALNGGQGAWSSVSNAPIDIKILFAGRAEIFSQKMLEKQTALLIEVERSIDAIDAVIEKNGGRVRCHFVLLKRSNPPGYGG